MAKTLAEIIQEAPVSAKYEEKIAFYCSDCPWWTSDWKHFKTKQEGPDKMAVCPKCDHHLREAPLEWYIDQHVNALSREDKQKFIDSFASNQDPA